MGPPPRATCMMRALSCCRSRAVLPHKGSEPVGYPTGVAHVAVPLLPVHVAVPLATGGAGSPGPGATIWWGGVGSSGSSGGCAHVPTHAPQGTGWSGMVVRQPAGSYDSTVCLAPGLLACVPLRCMQVPSCWYAARMRGR